MVVAEYIMRAMEREAERDRGGRGLQNKCS